MSGGDCVSLCGLPRKEATKEQRHGAQVFDKRQGPAVWQQRQPQPQEDAQEVERQYHHQAHLRAGGGPLGPRQGQHADAAHDSEKGPAGYPQGQRPDTEASNLIYLSYYSRSFY